MTKSIPELRLQELGLKLPVPPKPVANYTAFKKAGPLLFLSGQVPYDADGVALKGTLGKDVSVEEGYACARVCALQLIAVAKLAVGDLSKLSVTNVRGMVNATPDFADHPHVVNGASDLFVDVFGDAGRHARSAFGAGSLPSNVVVEVEAIFELLE
ncbi:RidA family protein [Phyllobacterium sp. UNC302MFCol5.2]|uniref:RidA family protein n=1 Tax=Phyllobacterium sp. UNC302MFCol5.2 TaxID=1449065 RepID=UPI000480CC83|nr:RidA family protein [Phyllobacterium sp. UNC302MFCol5.2]